MNVTKTVPFATFPCFSCAFVAKKVFSSQKHTENTEGEKRHSCQMGLSKTLLLAAISVLFVCFRG